MAFLQTAVAPSVTVAQQYVLTDEAELSAVAQRADRGHQPWKNAYDQVLQRADRALTATPRSVTDNGAPQNGDRHSFGNDAPYTTDGIYDEEANRGDYRAAGKMGDWVRDLALAYQLTGEDRYARRAIDLIYHWALDPDTYMRPRQADFGPHSPDFRSSSSIVVYITVPKLVYGASLVGNHPYWDQKPGDAEAAFRNWARELLADAEEQGESIKNNHWVWHVFLRASFASYLGDSSSLETAFQEWKWSTYQIDSQGELKKERDRTRGLFYSLYAIKAYTLTAEIARHHGVDLYGYEDDAGGSVLKRAFDEHVQYLLDEAEWPYEQINELDMKDAVVPYEMAYSHWGDTRYRDVLRKAGRPTDGKYIMGGSATLTHGNVQNLTSAVSAPGDENLEIPERFTLEPNVPNPFNPSTTIAYHLPRETPVQLIVYTMLGQKVGVLVDRTQRAGRHTTRFHAGILPSGSYLYVLQAGPATRTRRMTLVN